MEVIRETMVLENSGVNVQIPGKGMRKLLSINSISVPRILDLLKELSPDSSSSSLGTLLPNVMAMTEAPLGDMADIDYESEDGTEKTISLTNKETDKNHETLLNALKKNFEGIIALGKVAGLTENEMSVLFTVSLQEHKEFKHQNGMEMHESMEEMLGNANIHDSENWNKCQHQ
ncbi:unnamed protein product [Phytomonas sp. Hart1]|nr:unnamed protein product [Phytomonas sp. Hart1]|eukprot:CCW70102.1 unnamed protein product [Phytomonas sp. isolate Hart1]